MTTGAIRKIDKLGRIVVPSELRHAMNIHTDDFVEMYMENNTIMLKKHIPSMTCMVTGENSDKNIRLADGKIIVSPKVAKKMVEELGEKTGEKIS